MLQTIMLLPDLSNFYIDYVLINVVVFMTKIIFGMLSKSFRTHKIQELQTIKVSIATKEAPSQRNKQIVNFLLPKNCNPATISSLKFTANERAKQTNTFVSQNWSFDYSWLFPIIVSNWFDDISCCFAKHALRHNGGHPFRCSLITSCKTDPIAPDYKGGRNFTNHIGNAKIGLSKLTFVRQLCASWSCYLLRKFMSWIEIVTFTRSRF